MWGRSHPPEQQNHFLEALRRLRCTWVKETGQDDLLTKKLYSNLEVQNIKEAFDKKEQHF
jgi:hypothetical protein